ncbi:MAG: sigma-70 family RNA polymerase sigma factor [Gemmatimonadota bacterium]
MSEVTQLLIAWRDGNEAALERLVPLMYDELRAIASRQLGREHAAHTLQTTALVHEAYLRLVGTDVSWNGRSHFFAVAARVMRRILVDQARARHRAKRGGDEQPITLDERRAAAAEPDETLLALHEALERLLSLDERKARVIELHHFGGLNYEEVADVLQISPATVHRELRLARAWLNQELRAEA